MNPRALDIHTTLKAELKVIPAAAWVVMGVVLLLWYALAIPLLLQVAPPKPGEPPLWLLRGLLALAGVILAVWVLMVFYVNADARRRQMNRTLWTLLVIFIPNAIGFIVYFLLRQPVAQACAKCGASVRPGFVFCPVCGVALSPTCPSCHQPVEPGWAACAFCGSKLG